MKWTEDLSVGVGQIDRQHQDIFKIYNDFMSACKTGNGRENLSDLLDFLDNYTQEHFRHEEEIMEKHKFPDMEIHKASHRDFAETVTVFKTRMATEGATLSLLNEISHTLHFWLMDHIKKSDMDLGSYINLKWGLY